MQKKNVSVIPGENSQVPDLEECSLVDLLLQVKEVLDEHNVEFWLECGTLLGAVRNVKFISWEHDIDLGVWQDGVSDNIKSLMSREFSNRGLKIYLDKHYITVCGDNRVWADINFYHHEGDKAIVTRLSPKNKIGKFLDLFCRTLSAPFFYEVDFKKKSRLFIRSMLILVSRSLPSFLRMKMANILKSVYEKKYYEDHSWVVPVEYIEKLLTIEFYGMEFKVPAKMEEYLAYRYGEDWRIPKKDWITERDDGAVAH